MVVADETDDVLDAKHAAEHELGHKESVNVDKQSVTVNLKFEHVGLS